MERLADERNDALDMRYVEFNLECKLNYDTQGVPTPKSEVEARKKAASEAAAAGKRRTVRRVRRMSCGSRLALSSCGLVVHR